MEKIFRMIDILAKEDKPEELQKVIDYCLCWLEEIMPVELEGEEDDRD